MSPEMISIIGMGVGLSTLLVAFAGLVVTLLLRLERRLDHTNERIDHLVAEVRVIAQNQARADQQIIALIDKVKTHGEQIKDLVAEMRASEQRQARADQQLTALTDQVKTQGEQMKDQSEQMKALAAEVRAIARDQARVDQQVKDLAVQVKDLVAELKTIAQGQARMEGEVLTLKDAILAPRSPLGRQGPYRARRRPVAPDPVVAGTG